jgi:hypothetical protein
MLNLDLAQPGLKDVNQDIVCANNQEDEEQTSPERPTRSFLPPQVGLEQHAQTQQDYWEQPQE